MKPAPIQRDPSNRKVYQGSKPLLKVSLNEKTKKDFEHSKNVVDFFIESTYFNDQYSSRSGNFRDLYVLYDAYNNKIPESYFNYVTNPLSSTRKEHASFPARIRPYSILRPNIDLLLGEFDKRPKNFTVVVTNSDSVKIAEDLLYQATVNYLEQQFVAKIQDPNAEAEESPQQFKDKFLSNYKDERAIWGQDTLERMERELQIKEEWGIMFKDYTIAGELYSCKGVDDDGNPYYERVSPLDIDYDKSPDKRYIEDASWVVRRRFMTPSDVVNMFYKELSTDNISTMEDQDATLPFHSTYFNNLFGNTYRSEEDLKRAKIIVYHVVWRYYKLIGFRTYYDPETSQIAEDIVEEGYKKSENDLNITWAWVTDFWEGYRLDTPNITSNPAAQPHGAEILYAGIRSIPYQRNRLVGFKQNKNPYNGMRFSDTHSRNISILELGMPYQILYMVLHYRLELTIAKSKGKIVLLDKNVIPNGKGWDEEKFFYWAEANNFALIDRSQRGVDKSMNQYSVLDMGLYQHIENLISIMDYVRLEWDQVVGFTPQRKGQTSASETASGIDAARYQSSVISERLFTSFDNFMRRELQGLLDISKFGYNQGKKASLYSDDMRTSMLAVDGAVYAESEFDVHVSNSGEDLRNLEMLKGQAGQFASQGAKPSVVAEVLEANNISKLKQILRKAEEQEMNSAMQAQKSEEESKAKLLEIERAYASIQAEFDLLLQEKKYDREETLAHIKGQYGLADTNTPGDSLDPAALQKSMDDRLKLAQARELKDKELNLKDKTNQRDNETKKYVADVSLKVAEENKQKGEK